MHNDQVSNSEMASGVSSVSHPIGEYFLLYISSENKELPDLSELSLIFLASACNNPTLLREGRYITSSLRSLANVFRKRPLGCPLLLFFFLVLMSSVWRGARRPEDLHDWT